VEISPNFHYFGAVGDKDELPRFEVKKVKRQCHDEAKCNKKALWEFWRSSDQTWRSRDNLSGEGNADRWSRIIKF